MIDEKMKIVMKTVKEATQSSPLPPACLPAGARGKGKRVASLTVFTGHFVFSSIDQNVFLTHISFYGAKTQSTLQVLMALLMLLNPSTPKMAAIQIERRKHW